MSLTLRGGSTVIGGAFAAVGGHSFVWLLGIPTSILIARAVGAEGRGEYYLPVIAAALTIALFQLSIETANQIAVAELKLTPARLLRNVTGLALVLGPVAVAALLGAFAVTRTSVFDGVSVEDVLIVAATVPFGLHQAWVSGLFVITKQITRSQIALVAGAVAYLVGAAALYVADELGVTQVLLLYAMSIVLPWALHLWWARGIGPLRPSLERGTLGRIVALGMQLHPGHVAFYLLLKFDIFLVSAYLGVDDVGLYSLAVMLVDPLWIGTYALVQASVPFQLSRSLTEATALAFKSARFNFLLTLLASVLMASCFWALIPALYGTDFSDSYAALVVLLPGIWAISAARPFMILLPRTAKPGRYVGILIGAFALNCALNALLLPAIGIVGASIASSVSYWVITIAFVRWALQLSTLTAREALLPQPEDRETLRRIVDRLLRRSAPEAG